MKPSWDTVWAIANLREGAPVVLLITALRAMATDEVRANLGSSAVPLAEALQ